MADPSARSGPDTFPRLLLQHAQERSAHPACREKDLGIWQTWTWGQVADEVRALACGLAAQGFRRGMHLAIIGDNRPRLYWSMLAAQALGGIPVPMYQDAPGGRVRVRAEGRGDRLRDRRGPGAGRQDAGGGPAGPVARAHLLRRSARLAQLRARHELRAAAGGRPRIRPRPSGLVRRRDREGRAGRRVGHALHVGHHRQAQGRVPDALRRSSHPRAAAARSTS